MSELTMKVMSCRSATQDIFSFPYSVDSSSAKAEHIQYPKFISLKVIQNEAQASNGCSEFVYFI